MNASTDPAFSAARTASRRAYERGRVRLAAVHAFTFCLLGAALSLVLVGSRSLAWLPLTFAAWAVLEWRGVGLLRGGRIGALAGVVTLALPLSVLHRCCKPGALAAMGADCCSMPGACAGAGALVGLVLAGLVPVKGRRVEVALGMALGVAAVAPLKCAGLLAGEAFGLVGGLLAGVLAASMARAVLARWTVRA